MESHVQCPTFIFLSYTSSCTYHVYSLVLIVPHNTYALWAYSKVVVRSTQHRATEETKIRTQRSNIQRAYAFYFFSHLPSAWAPDRATISLSLKPMR